MHRTQPRRYNGLREFRAPAFRMNLDSHTEACFPRAETSTLNSPTTEIQKLVLKRVVIEAVEPEVDCGRFAIKRTVGERVVVQADIFADGHEVLGAVLRYRPCSEAA